MWLVQSRRGKNLAVLSCVALVAGTAAFGAGFAAEYRVAIMLAAVVTREAAFSGGLFAFGVRCDFHRRGRILVVASADGVTGATISVDVTDVGFVRKQRAVRFAGTAINRNVIASLFRVTNGAAGFLRGFLIAAPWRMANVTFRMRGNPNRFGLVRLLMTEIAVGFLSGRQVVGDVRFVLFGIKNSVEIIPGRKIVLRWTRRQSLLGVVADCAGFLRQ